VQAIIFLPIMFLCLLTPINSLYVCRTLKFHVVISSKSAKKVQSVQIHQIAGNDKVLVANLTPRFEFI